MKKKILIFILSAVCCLGFVFTLKREPTIEIGRFVVSTEENKYTIHPIETAIYRNSELKTFKVKTNVKSHLDSMKKIDQIVAKNPFEEDVDVATETRVNYYGDLYSAIYTIYDAEGNVIEDDLDVLKLPTKDMNSCIVRANVKWGRKSNYRQCIYFFKVNFIKPMQ